jgi:hypothetical protein
LTDSPELTQTQATLLAHILHEIRPDWAITSMMSLLWEHRAAHPFPALVIAAVRAASTPTNRTPAVIFMEGKHWRADGDQPREQPPPGPACEDHPEQQAHICHCCKADILVGDRPATHQGKHWNTGSTP